MPYREEPLSRKPAMTDKQPPASSPAKTGAAKPAVKAQPYKGPPANKADHAAFKRIDKTAIKRMRKK
jgi:hypothetical protein